MPRNWDKSETDEPCPCARVSRSIKKNKLEEKTSGVHKTVFLDDNILYVRQPVSYR